MLSVRMFRPAAPRLTAMRHRLAFALALFLLPTAIWASPVPYAIDRTASTVGFAVDYVFGKITGAMPLGRTHLVIDFRNPPKSAITVTLRPRFTTASLPYAATAMKGAKGFDVQRYPVIRFRSTQVTAQGDTIRITGKATIRGITRPLTLEARLFRVAGEAVGDNRQLTMRITGTIQRSAFGADGWENIVSDDVQLAILAHLDRIDPPPHQN